MADLQCAVRNPGCRRKAEFVCHHCGRPVCNRCDRVLVDRRFAKVRPAPAKRTPAAKRPPALLGQLAKWRWTAKLTGLVKRIRIQPKQYPQAHHCPACYHPDLATRIRKKFTLTELRRVFRRLLV